MIDVSVLVSGRDAWAVLWVGFCHFWNKFWTDCPWPLYFMSNTREAPCGQTLYCGEDDNWTAMMVNALQQIQTRYLLFMLDDYWLTHPVDTPVIVQFAEHLERYNAHHIRLQSADPNTQGSIGSFEPDPRLFVIGPNAPYRMCLQSALWDKQVLQSLLSGRENPWQFETNATGRSQRRVRALCIDRSHTPDQWNGWAYFCYHNIVSQGQWCDRPIDDSRLPDVQAFIERYG